MKRLILSLAAILLLATALSSGIALAQDKPEFKLGFKALADQIPDVVGQPIEEERWGDNGDSLQTTSNGMMVWRKVDNWTAFTNGSRTWINGPNGVQDRANNERFDWERQQPQPTVQPTMPPPEITIPGTWSLQETRDFQLMGKSYRGRVYAVSDPGQGILGWVPVVTELDGSGSPQQEMLVQNQEERNAVALYTLFDFHDPHLFRLDWDARAQSFQDLADLSNPEDVDRAMALIYGGKALFSIGLNMLAPGAGGAIGLAQGGIAVTDGYCSWLRDTMALPDNNQQAVLQAIIDLDPSQQAVMNQQMGEGKVDEYLKRGLDTLVTDAESMGPVLHLLENRDFFQDVVIHLADGTPLKVANPQTALRASTIVPEIALDLALGEDLGATAKAAVISNQSHAAIDVALARSLATDVEGLGSAATPGDLQWLIVAIQKKTHDFYRVAHAMAYNYHSYLDAINRGSVGQGFTVPDSDLAELAGIVAEYRNYRDDVAHSIRRISEDYDYYLTLSYPDFAGANAQPAPEPPLAPAVPPQPSVSREPQPIGPDNARQIAKLRTFEGTPHVGGLSSMAFSPNGAILASGGVDGSVKSWDVATGRERHTLAGPGGLGNRCVVFSLDGALLAGGGWQNGLVRVWDVNSGRELYQLKGHTTPVNGLAFLPDGKTLVSGSIDHTVRSWDLSSGSEIRARQVRFPEDMVMDLDLTGDGKTLLVSTDRSRVRLWDIATNREVRTLEGVDVDTLALSADGKTMALVGNFHKTIPLWDMGTVTQTGALPGHAHTTWSRSLALSPDGRVLASIGNADGRHLEVKLWDVSRRTEIITIPNGSVATFSPDGKLLAINSDINPSLWAVLP